MVSPPGPVPVSLQPGTLADAPNNLGNNYGSLLSGSRRESFLRNPFPLVPRSGDIPIKVGNEIGAYVNLWRNRHNRANFRCSFRIPRYAVLRLRHKYLRSLLSFDGSQSDLPYKPTVPTAFSSATGVSNEGSLLPERKHLETSTIGSASFGFRS